MIVLKILLRSSLTVLAVAIAILAFGLLRTVIDAWYAGVEAASAARLITRNAISLITRIELKIAEKECRYRYRSPSRAITYSRRPASYLTRYEVG